MCWTRRIGATATATAPSKYAYWHQVTLLGDDFAAGVGDTRWFYQPPGVSWPLQQEWQHEPSIRQSWQILQRGVLHSRLANWRPASSQDGAKEHKRCPLSRSLLAQVLADPRIEETDLFVLFLGSNDLLTQSLFLFYS